MKSSSHHQVRGVVQIAHGLGEHMGRYAELAEKLVEGDFVVYGNDHRGHGLTAKPSGSFGEFGRGGFDQLVEDMVSLEEIAKKEHPDKPYILLGHSMGSFAAQQFVLEHSHSIDGLALTGSGALDGLARLAQSVPAREDPMKLMNAAFEPAHTPFDWLSRDNAKVDAFINDPLCFPSLTPKSMESFLGAAQRLADPPAIQKVRHDLPIYIFSGSDDPVGQRLEGLRVLIDRYRSAGLTSIAHDFYSGGRHEMLHEINRREVMAKLLTWVSGIVERASG
ncbi:MAG TPA: alpha/beta fold hydrolase [Candidatus Udaeobacter sp.]|nr:alpha/beta fold hydrolase [Candidatus Udaeobacter sp.]